MPYQSPLHILDSLDIEPDQINTEGLNRLRKKLLAEFSLNPAVTININSKTYTKDEILKTIDVLKETDNLAGHEYVFERKKLLNWLEDPTKAAMPVQELKATIEEKQAEEFVMNTVATALLEKIKNNVRKRNFKATKPPLSIVKALPFYYLTDIYDFLYDELQSIIEAIEAARSEANVAEGKKIFGFIVTNDWTDFLNELPEDFEGVKDDYCRSAVNYSVAVQKKDKKWVFNISQQLIKTHCDESLVGVINDNHKIYADNYSGSSLTDWGWVRIVLFVLFIIARMSSCSKNSTSSRDYNSSEIEQKAASRILPASTFYIVRVQSYRDEVVKKRTNKPADMSLNIKTGEEPLPRLNYFNEAEISNVDIEDSKLIQFSNTSGFDVVVFKAGAVKNRSWFIKNNELSTINCSPNDILFFYFGTKWTKITNEAFTLSYESRLLDLVILPFEGYFKYSTDKMQAIFNNDWTIKSVNAVAQITFTSKMVTKTGKPILENISLSGVNQ